MQVPGCSTLVCFDGWRYIRSNDQSWLAGEEEEEEEEEEEGDGEEEEKEGGGGQYFIFNLSYAFFFSPFSSFFSQFPYQYLLSLKNARGGSIEAAS